METRRLTRRQMALAAVAVPGIAAAQTPTSAAESEPARTKAEERRNNSEALRKIKLPQLLEPSFVFRP